MIANNKECATWLWGIKNKCNKIAGWITNKWCQQSCYDGGYGYEDDSCGEDAQACTDEPSHYMIANNKECATWSWGIKNKCNKIAGWITNKWCQQSCYDGGYGYEDDSCGEDAQACMDEPSEYMVANNKECATWSWGIKN